MCQALFIAPCSHVYHFKCIRPLLQMHHPGFSCPLCRTFADLEADVETEECVQATPTPPVPNPNSTTERLAVPTELPALQESSQELVISKSSAALLRTTLLNLNAGFKQITQWVPTFHTRHRWMYNRLLWATHRTLLQVMTSLLYGLPPWTFWHDVNVTQIAVNNDVRATHARFPDLEHAPMCTSPDQTVPDPFLHDRTLTTLATSALSPSTAAVTSLLSRQDTLNNPRGPRFLSPIAPLHFSNLLEVSVPESSSSGSRARDNAEEELLGHVEKVEVPNFSKPSSALDGKKKECARSQTLSDRSHSTGSCSADSSSKSE